MGTNEVSRKILSVLYVRLARAARDLVDTVDKNHDTKPPPMKYTVPWELVTRLRVLTDKLVPPVFIEIHEEQAPWEIAFSNYLKANWPGFSPDRIYDFHEKHNFETIREAFKAGWDYCATEPT